MSEKNPIRVFVTHLFDEDADYQRVFEYLESRERFFYVNTAKPDDMPTGSGVDPIKDELRKQINAAEMVIVPVATYERNPELVGFQMDVAGAFKKPLLGIRSFGGTVMIEKDFMNRCDDLVEWDDRVITDAIKKLARDEDTSQWEVIEFNPEEL